MTHYNPIFRKGLEMFCSELAEAGGDGVLVVDLPPEESSELDDASRKHGLDVIRLVAPSTSDSRIVYLLSAASGFVYVVSSSGTTGVKDRLPSSAYALLGRVVPKSPVPALLGFGVSEPQHVREALALGAAGIVEGSRLVAMHSASLGDRHEALRDV